MKPGTGIKPLPALALAALGTALDCWNFSGALHTLNFADFALCALLPAALFGDEASFLIAAAVSGLALDSMTGEVFHVPAFIAAGFAARSAGALFFHPRSGPHVMTVWMMVMVYSCAAYLLCYLRDGEAASSGVLAAGIAVNTGAFFLFCAFTAGMYPRKSLF
ncbi:MAG: hypothetical protein AB1742_07760 [bacterium]